MNTKDEIIYEYDTKPTERIRFTCSEFEGKTYYHIRTYVYSKDFMDHSDIWIPTKKGISFTLDEFPKFAEGIIKLKDYIDSNGS